jgi:hypothetical protein
MIKKNYKLPAAYNLGSEGCGCAGEPPGHPRYFVRSIYTKSGNCPPYNKPQYYLNGTGFMDLKEVDLLYGTNSFPKLPLDHPRTRGWIKGNYKHFNHCYYHPTEKEYNRPMTVIYPVPNYKLKSFVDDPRFSDEWREKEKASIEAYNNDIFKMTKEVAVPENHCAVVIIREYYPEYLWELDLIENPPKITETWWERINEKPTPENCPGSKSLRTKHPVNGSWCQVCGWHKE